MQYKIYRGYFNNTEQLSEFGLHIASSDDHYSGSKADSCSSLWVMSRTLGLYVHLHCTTVSCCLLHTHCYCYCYCYWWRLGSTFLHHLRLASYFGDHDSVSCGFEQDSWRHCCQFFNFPVAVVIHALLRVHVSPPHAVCDGPDQAAHLHARGTKLRDSSLIWRFAGIGVKVLYFLAKSLTRWPQGKPGTWKVTRKWMLNE
jgi:hypothetical protein